MLFSMLLVFGAVALTVAAVGIWMGQSRTNDMTCHENGTAPFGLVWVVAMVVLVLATAAVWVTVLTAVCGGLVAHVWVAALWWLYLVGLTQLLHWLTFFFVMKKIKR